MQQVQEQAAGRATVGSFDEGNRCCARQTGKIKMTETVFTLTVLGGAIGLALLACLAVIVGRMNDLDNRCRCNGDCRQGRDCPARRPR